MLLEEAGVSLEKPWAQVSKKEIGSLATVLANHQINVIGKVGKNDDVFSCDLVCQVRQRV